MFSDNALMTDLECCVAKHEECMEHASSELSPVQCICLCDNMNLRGHHSQCAASSETRDAFRTLGFKVVRSDDTCNCRLPFCQGISPLSHGQHTLNRVVHFTTVSAAQTA